MVFALPENLNPKLVDLGEVEEPGLPMYSVYMEEGEEENEMKIDLQAKYIYYSCCCYYCLWKCIGVYEEWTEIRKDWPCDLSSDYLEKYMHVIFHFHCKFSIASLWDESTLSYQYFELLHLQLS